MSRAFRAAPREAREAAWLRLLALAITSAIALAAPSAAHADVFSPISLVSYGAIGGSEFVQQAEYAHDSAISADGRYVAFDGSIGGVTGVWRRDLDTDVIEQVAGGDAAMPSISETGQFVSFTTNEGESLPEITHARPDADPHAEAVNVYRRDMAVEPAASTAEEAARAPAERAFQAASVPSGSEQPLRYAEAGEHGGSYAVGRTAISANGEEVAFVTAAVSDLVAYPELEEEERARGQTPAPHAPAGQVAVHWFGNGATELVSRCRFECGQGPAAGAAEPVVATESESRPVGAVATGAVDFPQHGRAGSWPGASISADGTTVAWTGVNIAQQAPTLAREDLEADYQEPLWRRLPAAANEARRVTGGSDPEAPGCAASGELALAHGSDSASDPCQGPFVRETAGPNEGGGLIKGPADDDTPRLSSNGEEVVFGANARLVSEGSDFDRGEAGNPTDLFLVSMHPGLTRTQAITPLTEAGISEAEGAEITDWEISPDGTQVAFTTLRTLFTLGWPTLVSIAPPEVGIAELYDADLANGTLTRVTHGYEGEGEQSQQPHPIIFEQSGDPYDESRYELGALTPDFSANGDELVFTSTAANLVYGDGNSPAVPVVCCQPGDGSDVFEVTRRQFLSEPAPQSISPPPPLVIAPLWRLSATAQAHADGSVALYVEVPGAGRLQVAAQGGLVLVEHGRGARRRVTLATRTVAADAATETAPAGGLMQIVLRLQSRYAALAKHAGGLPASLRITFTAQGRPTLEQTLAVAFTREDHARTASAARRASKAPGRRGKTR
ncbi:MAG TPA: hypothetical protein VMF09_15315 [Solirubrobacteraceae bacterium]|nr:hypothetical protein [Solirubrobacteraceae bacterium]